MKVKDLIETLKTINPDANVYVACDEEWNTVFASVNIEYYNNKKGIVLYGLSGSEKEE